MNHTGFTNFYKAYRNSARDWVKDTFAQLLPLFEEAYRLANDDQALSIVRRIQALPGVPKANNPRHRMRPEYLLSPALFSLDGRVRFPIINGNEGVANLLNALKATSAPLNEQFARMIALYGSGTGIKDAADLDQIGRDLPEFVSTHNKKPLKKLFEEKLTKGAKLALKDECDIETLQQARTLKHKRLHNQLTNRLSALLPTHTLLEGRTQQAMFDVLVTNFDGKKHNLLVEVKSSVEPPHIRMAVGQLFDYSYHLGQKDRIRLSVLLPDKPDEQIRNILRSLNIGLLWFAENELKTADEWLQVLTAQGPSTI